MAMNQKSKSAVVEKLIRELDDDLSTRSLSNAHRQGILEQLKVHGRDPNGADAIYCSHGITTLTKYAFGDFGQPVIQEALRVTANALLLRPNLQTIFIGLDGVPLVTKLYHNQDNDFEFLGARILFLCTYAANVDLDSAFNSGLISNIQAHLTRHADQSRQHQRQTPSSPMASMAITETVKLIFNLHDKAPEKCKALNDIIPDLCSILQNLSIPPAPLDPPIGSILNALACLDFGAVPVRSTASDSSDQAKELVPSLVKILDRSVKHYEPAKLDTIALSLFIVLRMLYDTSSSGVQAQMREALLPADSERDLPLGKSSSLASRLLRLTTSPGLTHLPETISSLMFEMSNKDAAVFIRNIGYGYAAGYLMTHKIPIPQLAEGASIDTSADRVPINPVTGQRLDREIQPEIPDMTEGEKEREAERLFVLFDRLKATGVVDVENPVRKAMEEGRLEDLSDSDPD